MIDIYDLTEKYGTVNSLPEFKDDIAYSRYPFPNIVC